MLKEPHGDLKKGGVLSASYFRAGKILPKITKADSFRLMGKVKELYGFIKTRIVPANIVSRLASPRKATEK